jgi:hypothetical protein
MLKDRSAEIVEPTSAVKAFIAMVVLSIDGGPTDHVCRSTLDAENTIGPMDLSYRFGTLGF